MKLFLVLMFAVMSGSAFAQKHMVEFNADSIMMGAYRFSSSKYAGENAEEDKYGYLYINYAYTILPNIQVGVRGNYAKSRFANSKSENYELQAGAIYNFNTDLARAFYVSAYGGFSWDGQYDSDYENTHSENLIGTLAIGKRFPLTFLNLENITYSPEISFSSENSTKSQGEFKREWHQEFAIKYLQFSVLF
jgi:hypothetical protein